MTCARTTRGDFNVVRRLEENSNGGRFTRNMKFNLLIDDLNLFDVPMKNGSFTWSDLRERPVATRIDRIGSFSLKDGLLLLKKLRNNFGSIPPSFEVRQS